MRSRVLLAFALILPMTLASQTPDAVMLEFGRFADIYGSRLVTAFDSIPASRYDFRPTPVQQTVGYIAQHLETANYGLCERLGDVGHPRTAKDSLADTVKARWPKDTLVARLKASLRFCDDALERTPRLQSAARASTLLAFETDLAEHYSQLAVYMRLLGLVPPSALPRRQRTAIALPDSALAPYVGTYQLAPGLELTVTKPDSMLAIRSTAGGPAVRLWAESRTDFFVKEADAQVTFTRSAGGAVTGLVLHQYGRDRPAGKTAPKAGTQVRTAITQNLPAMNGNGLRTTVVEVAYAPGDSSLPHHHPCAVIGYVIEGEFRSQSDGGPVTIYRAGDSFYEAPNRVHRVSANASKTQPVRFTATFLCDRDTTLSIREAP